MKKLIFPLLALLIVVITACEDELSEDLVDITAPVILITAPVSDSEFYPNQYIPVKATVTDETYLEEVVITFSGLESLTNTYTRKNGEQGINFEENKIDHVDFTFPLSSGTSPGTYLLTIQATDRPGNQATEQSVTIHILEDDLEKPQISLEEPQSSDSYHPGEIITISGTVSDNAFLKVVKISLQKSGESPILEKEISSFENGLSYSINEQISIPENATVGDYTLTIEGEDRKGNIQTIIITVVVDEEAPQEE